jgi:hypothetical protein
MTPQPLGLFAILALIGAPLAASAAVAADAPTRVSGVEVVTGPGPRVTASFPADGAGVAAGVLVLKLTFDQAMAPGSWGYGRSPLGDFPDCLAQPRLLADRRTFALLCTVAPGRTYAIQINPAPDFKNANGRSAKPYSLRFTTTAAVTRDMEAALAQAGLTPADEPLMSWDDPGKGVSQSPPPPADADDQPAR